MSTDPILEARKFIVRAGRDAAGPLTSEASAVNDWQRLTAMVGATIVAHHAYAFLIALNDVAPEKARTLAAELNSEAEDYDGYSGEMLHHLAEQLDIPEFHRKPFPAEHTVDGTNYDLTKQYRDRDGHTWRFEEWNDKVPEFISVGHGLRMGNTIAGFIESLPRLIERHGPIAPVDAEAQVA